MTDLYRIQHQLRKFDFYRSPRLVETDRDGTRLVLDVPLYVQPRAGGGLRLQHVLYPFAEAPALAINSRFVFDQDGSLLLEECDFCDPPC